MSFCSNSLSAQLTIEVDGENIPCFGLSNGSATAVPLDGTGPYSFLWSNGETTATIEGLPAGIYAVTVTDDTGDNGTGEITLTQPPRLEATISDPVECEAPFNIAANPSGGTSPYTYSWSTGADTRAISVPVGDYCVTVVDFNLCGYVACTTVEENPPEISLVAVDVLCNGNDDGTITANISGGVPPYAYAWSNGGSGPSVDGLSPGNYGLTVTDARGCMASADADIVEPPVITGEIAGNDEVCEGVASAFIFIVPSGGTPPYSYAWNVANATGQGVGPLPAGIYEVTVTDDNDCQIVRSYEVFTAEEVDIEIVGDTILCGLNARGDLSVQPATGPLDQYVYTWSDGTVGPTLFNVPAGTYTVTATDVNGCTGVATATLTTIDVDVTLSSTDASCSDRADGTATATVTGGEMPYTYEWSTGESTATITGLAAGVYSVTITESSTAACKVSGSVVVEAPDELEIMVDVEVPLCAGDNNGSINVTVAGGTAPYTYLWSNGAMTEDLMDLAPGNYAVTVTDINNCTASRLVQITAPDPIALDAVIADVACTGENTGSIALTASGGEQPYTFLWSNGATTSTITDLPAGDYAVTVMDVSECQLVASYTVGEAPQLTLSGEVFNIFCEGDPDGRINLTVAGGTPPYTYLWSNGTVNEDLNGVPAGNYGVTVSDASNCMASATFEITEPPAIMLTVVPVNVSCNGGTDGEITVGITGGTAPYIIRLDNVIMTSPITDLPAGTYVVSIADDLGCSETTTVVIQEPTPFAVTAAVTNVICAGETTGAIDLTVTGATPGYTYLWSTGATTQDIEDLPAGTYTVVVTDANNCTFSASYDVNASGAVSIAGEVTPANCNGAATGQINITATGGAPAYTYLWSNGETTEDLEDLVGGTYTVTVTDANNCDAVATFNVTEPPAIMVAVDAPTIQCGGTSTGTLTASPSGGTPPYSFAWSNGNTGAMITGLAAGVYAVTVTDASGCTEVATGITLDELPALTCEIVINQQPTEGDNGSITVQVDGGTFPYSYEWDDNSTDPDRDDLPAGTYGVTVTDANNCTTSCIVTLQAFSGIGNFVWEDLNANGQQDPGERGLDDYPVYLKNAAGIIIDSIRTDLDGFYAFTGLTPGTYSILFIEPPGGIRTTANFGDDTTDSDGIPAMNGMTDQYVLAPGEFNMTVDAGFFAEPNGGISDPCNCLNNNTTNFDGQFSEQIQVSAQPGQNWVVVEPTNMFLLSSPAPPLPPIPVPVGTVLTESPDPDIPGNSLYTLDFLIVDSLRYSAVLSNGPFQLSIDNECFYPEVRYVETPPEIICRFEAAILLEGFGVLNGVGITGTTVFTINGVEVTEIDPMSLPLGLNIITAEFTPDPPLDMNGLEICMPIGIREFVLVDDCLAQVGDFVWNDTNRNGIQDDGEVGIPDVRVVLSNETGTFSEETTTDENGRYLFTVPPGDYWLTFEQPDGFDATLRNSGSDDEIDSDPNPASLMTEIFTLGPSEVDLSWDAGFFPDCIENFDDGGTIAANQVLCGPGIVPDPIVETSPPTGGIGDIEYLWMMTTDASINNILLWTPIPNSNTPDYAPPALFETTYYARCVRRNNCAFIESNAITIIVENQGITDLEGPASVCVGDPVTYTAVNAGDATVTWSFAGDVTELSATDTSITLRWNAFGTQAVTVIIDDEGCFTSNTINVSVTNNPAQCGGNLMASGTVNNLQARDVTIAWEMSADGVENEFVLERSVNGLNFTPIATVTAPDFITANNLAIYRQDDVSPLAGRTFYRVRLVDPALGDVLSNIVEMQLGTPTTALGRVFPNPTRGGMIHVEMTEVAAPDAPSSVQLYDARGIPVGSRSFLDLGTGVLNLPTAPSTGVYFLRITVGDRTETHRVVVE